MDSLISRKAAIDALTDYIHNVDRVIGTGKLSMDDCRDAAESILEELPSAQPEIIRCKECQWWDRDGYCADFMTEEPNGFCSWAERREDETD